jgi:hypothetical protein
MWSFAFWLGSLVLAPASIEAQESPQQTPAETPAETPGQDAAETPPAEPHKVAVVLVGDPDERLLRAGERVRALLAARPDFREPSDAGMARALLGGGTEGDGLDPLRSERRGLGLDEARDAQALGRIGRMLGTTALIVVRVRNDAPEAVLFHVESRRQSTRGIALEGTEDAAVTAFVTETITSPPPAEAAPPRPAQEQARVRRDAPRQDGDAPDPNEDEEQEEEASWLEENWPFLIAGALLIGAFVWFTIEDGSAEPTPPVLRFRPGGD